MRFPKTRLRIVIRISGFVRRFNGSLFLGTSNAGDDFGCFTILKELPFKGRCDSCNGGFSHKRLNVFLPYLSSFVFLLSISAHLVIPMHIEIILTHEYNVSDVFRVPNVGN